MTRTKKKPRLKLPAVMKPFRNGFMITHTSYMWVEKTMKEAEAKSDKVYYNKYGVCCICRWWGVHMHEAMIDNTHYYIPICRKCENFMWGTYGNKPYAKIYFNPVETNRRKF